MTVIAYARGIMAADTMCVWDDVVKSSGQIKVYTVRGHLLGVSGEDVTAEEQFRSWFRSGCPERRPIPGSLDVMVVGPSGAISVWDQRLIQTKIAHPFFAIGSGREVALGALEVGASARQAVASAIKWSPQCGGSIMVKRLRKR